jgi:hypothetical protein
MPNSPRTFWRATRKAVYAGFDDEDHKGSKSALRVAEVEDKAINPFAGEATAARHSSQDQISHLAGILPGGNSMRSERDNAIELKKKKRKEERRKQKEMAEKKKRSENREDRTTHRRFKKEVDAGFIPAKINFHFGGRLLEWTKPNDQINPAKFLPKFFDGLFETEEPYRFLCQRGTLALLQRIKKEKLMKQIRPTLPQLVNRAPQPLYHHPSRMLTFPPVSLFSSSK